MRRDERRRMIVMLAEGRRLQIPVSLRSSEDSARSLFRSLVLTGLVRPRRHDAWRIILAAPPAGPRAS